jgi:hypothetical protein
MNMFRSAPLRRTAACLAALSAVALVSACSDPVEETPTIGRRDVPQDAGLALGHIHGLGVDPGDGTLYVASHVGVFRVSDDGTSERVADRWQDTMGFAVVGPSHFLGSGHPDLEEEDLPTSLGLIESTDAAQTWEPVSLLGDADLHAIEAVGDRIYAYDSTAGALVMTDNRTDWRTITQQPLYDLAAEPKTPDVVYATTDRGLLITSTNGSAPQPVTAAPVLTAIDWQPDGPLVGIAPDGAVMASTDGVDWTKVGEVDGPAEALDVVDGRWHAATSTGVYESTDDGKTWKIVVRHRM